ncbi:MAG: hypothetical protein HY895_10670 [Deltaproteobacteria bacterium]|nr:hypothetical protein [Deltaproteobacteria bacterium]
MDTIYSTFQAAKILDIEYVRLNEWLRGYFDPEQRAEGRGTRTKLSLNDLYRLKLFTLLLESGLSREIAKDICQQAKENKTSFSRGYIIAGKSRSADYFMFVLSDDLLDLNTKIRLTVDRTGKDLKMRFPIQIVISRPMIKELVDSKLSD